MKHKYSIVIAVIIAMLTGSCTERIDLDTSHAEPRLVIFGRINTDTTTHSVQINRSMPYFSSEAPEGISGARVEISSGSVRYVLTESDTLAGLYHTDSTAYGLEGNSYKLDVWLDYDRDGIQEHYEASSYLPYGPKIDSIALTHLMDKNDLPMIIVFGKAPVNQKNYFCLYTNKNFEPQQLFDYLLILNDNYLVTTGGIYIFPFLVDDGFQIGDTLSFRVDALNSSYAAFLSQASSEMRASMPFFSSPPAEVTTNISCLTHDVKVSGFFAGYHRGYDFSVIADFDYIIK